MCIIQTKLANNKLMYSKIMQFDAAKACNFKTHLKVLIFD